MNITALLRHRWGGDSLFLLPLVGLAFFWQLGTPALFDLDEGAFSAATWEMFQRGDFITTFLNGEPRFDKPILIYWLQALSVWGFGLHEWTLRLPSALAASVWVSATYYFAKPRFGLRSAMLAAIMVACSAMIVVIGRAATADALLNVLIVLSLFDIWRYWEQPQHRTLLRIFTWLGLGFLCKGPIAVAVPFIVSAALFLSQGQWRAWLKTVFYPWGLLLFVAIAAPWYALEYHAQGQAFIDGFFFKHNVDRFSSTMEGHGGTWWYYLAALPLIILPFSGLLLPLLAQGKRNFATVLQRFLWFWFAFVLVFFSFSNTQLPHYLLYGITPLLLLLAHYTAQHPQHRWLVVLPALLFGLVLIGLPEILQQVAQQQSSAYNQGLAQQAAAVLAINYRIASGLYVLILVILLSWPRLTSMSRMSAVAVVQTLLFTSVLIPSVAAIQQTPVKQAAAYAKHYLPNATIVMHGIAMPSFTVYRGKVTPQRAPAVGEYVFTDADYVRQLPDAKVVFEQGGLVIAQRRH